MMPERLSVTQINDATTTPAAESKPEDRDKLAAVKLTKTVFGPGTIAIKRWMIDTFSNEIKRSISLHYPLFKRPMCLDNTDGLF